MMQELKITFTFFIENHFHFFKSSKFEQVTVSSMNIETNHFHFFIQNHFIQNQVHFFHLESRSLYFTVAFMNMERI